MKTNILGWAVVMLMLTACSPGPIRGENFEALSRNFEPYAVDLEVLAGKLVVTSLPQGDDSRGKQKGWVGFAKGKHGIIEFLLKGQSNTHCTGDPATSAEWVMTEVVLSKFGKEETQKGEKFGKGPLAWLERAFPTIDEDGYLVKEPIATAQTSATLINLNNNNGGQMAFYEVEVQRCDGTGNPLRTDPGIGNRGK